MRCAPPPPVFGDPDSAGIFLTPLLGCTSLNGPVGLVPERTSQAHERGRFEAKTLLSASQQTTRIPSFSTGLVLRVCGAHTRRKWLIRCDGEPKGGINGPKFQCPHRFSLSTIIDQSEQPNRKTVSVDARVVAVRSALVPVLEEPAAIPGEAALHAETALAADWSRPEQDTAWSHLQSANERLSRSPSRTSLSRCTKTNVALRGAKDDNSGDLFCAAPQCSLPSNRSLFSVLVRPQVPPLPT